MMTGMEELVKWVYPVQNDQAGEMFVLPTWENVPVSVPCWTDYFLGIAYVTSKRSKDAQTQVGCVITDSDHHILGTGYNGPARGLPDDTLPNTRPDKYFLYKHAEKNALLNCTHRPKDGIAYVTGLCCFECLSDLYQSGITTVYMATNLSQVNMIDEKNNMNCSMLAHFTGLQIGLVEVDLSWLAPPKV